MTPNFIRCFHILSLYILCFHILYFHILSNYMQAYIVTLLSKLDIKLTSYQLAVCIDDGSATAAVSVSDQVIIDWNY